MSTEYSELWQYYDEQPEVLFHETIGNNECLVSKAYGSHIELYMRSRTGRWTHVQGFGRGSSGDTFSITKASNFLAPRLAMEAFLRACQEVL